MLGLFERARADLEWALHRSSLGLDSDYPAWPVA